MTATKTWLITGASKGLGLILTQQLLAAGHRVAIALLYRGRCLSSGEYQA